MRLHNRTRTEPRAPSCAMTPKRKTPFRKPTSRPIASSAPSAANPSFPPGWCASLRTRRRCAGAAIRGPLKPSSPKPHPIRPARRRMPSAAKRDASSRRTSLRCPRPPRGLHAACRRRIQRGRNRGRTRHPAGDRAFALFQSARPAALMDGGRLDAPAADAFAFAGARCDRIVQRVVVIARHLAPLSPLPDFFRRLPATYKPGRLGKQFSMSQIAPTARPATADDAAPAKTRDSLRILVADDDHDATLTLALLLKDEGHDVRMVHSGRTVIGAVIIFDPDVVILDIHMPGQSGWEAARAIRARRGQPQRRCSSASVADTRRRSLRAFPRSPASSITC